MFLKESTWCLLTFSEKTVKLVKNVVPIRRKHIFFGNTAGVATSDTAGFEHILVVWKMKVISYLYK